MTYNWHSSVKDIDTGSMAFRLLRLHGYSVSPSKQQATDVSVISQLMLLVL